MDTAMRHIITFSIATKRFYLTFCCLTFQTPCRAEYVTRTSLTACLSKLYTVVYMHIYQHAVFYERLHLQQTYVLNYQYICTHIYSACWLFHVNDARAIATFCWLLLSGKKLLVIFFIRQLQSRFTICINRWGNMIIKCMELYGE